MRRLLAVVCLGFDEGSFCGRGEAAVRGASAPVAVRYASADYPEGWNLDNGAGFPAAPSRMDHWDA